MDIAKLLWTRKSALIREITKHGLIQSGVPTNHATMCTGAQKLHTYSLSDRFFLL